MSIHSQALALRVVSKISELRRDLNPGHDHARYHEDDLERCHHHDCCRLEYHRVSRRLIVLVDLCPAPERRSAVDQ